MNPTSSPSQTITALPVLFPRYLSVLLLLSTATLFAANHVAARVAFDNGGGVVLAALVRSGFAFLALSAVVAVQRHAIALPKKLWGWQVLLGVLIAVQTVSLYSAIARLPVAIALLIMNTFPILLVLMTWLINRRAPRRAVVAAMAVILAGLVLVLNVPALLLGGERVSMTWGAGIAFAAVAALAFALNLWVVEHKLQAVGAVVRTWYLLGVVFVCMGMLAISGIMPGGMNLPVAAVGWLGIALLAVLYTVGFSLLYLNLPKLDMARNVSVMNFEPVASLLLGWLILGQTFQTIQLIGAAVVVGGIVLLANLKR